MSLPKLPTLRRKARKLSWKPVVAVALIFAILFLAFYPSRENPLNIVILHERVEALEEKVSIFSELDASLTSLEQQLEAVDALIENLLTQQTIINTQVSSINTWINGWESYWNSWLAGFGDWQAQINSWINGWEATWNSWLGSFGDWQAQVNNWINEWESYWDSWVAQLGETLEDIEAWITAVETYVYGVSNLLRQIHGAIVPLDYPSISSAVAAGENVITVVKTNLTDTIYTNKSVDIRLVNSVVFLSGNNSFSDLVVTGRNGALVLDCNVDFFGQVFLFENLNVSLRSFTLNIFSSPSDVIITHCRVDGGTFRINNQYSLPADQASKLRTSIHIYNNIFKIITIYLYEKDYFAGGVRYVSRTSGLISSNVFLDAVDFCFFLSGCDHALKISENCFGPVNNIALGFIVLNVSHPASHFQFEGNTILKDHPILSTYGVHIYFDHIMLASFVGNLIVLKKIDIPSGGSSYGVFAYACHKWVFTGNRIGVVAGYALYWVGDYNVFVGNEFIGQTNVTGTGNVITGNYGL